MVRIAIPIIDCNVSQILFFFKKGNISIDKTL